MLIGLSALCLSKQIILTKKLTAFVTPQLCVSEYVETQKCYRLSLSVSGPEGMHACQAIDADNGDYFRPPYNLRRDKQHVVFFMKTLLCTEGTMY